MGLWDAGGRGAMALAHGSERVLDLEGFSQLAWIKMTHGGPLRSLAEPAFLFYFVFVEQK